MLKLNIVNIQTSLSLIDFHILIVLSILHLYSLLLSIELEQWTNLTHMKSHCEPNKIVYSDLY